MNLTHRTFLIVVAFLIAAPLLNAQATEMSITKQMDKFHSLSAEQRPAATIKLAGDICTLPASPRKVELADELSHLVTEGYQGAEALQAVADTLSKALAESPIPAKKGPAAHAIP